MNSLPEIRKLIDDALAAPGLFPAAPAALYAPCRYALESPGKRLRPVALLLAYGAAGGAELTQALPLALAVEIFHTFTLVHDDIMDAAPTRRGRPCVHVQWDEPTAILAGDALYAKAQGLVSQNFPHKVQALNARFSRVALEVCEGQALDMAQANQPDVSPEDYLEMIRLKTAVLFGAALALGAEAADAPAATVEALQQFGEKAGLAFQLQDDWLDLFGDSGQTGKALGGDILAGKTTYFRLEAQARATPAQRTELAAAFALDSATQANEKVERVLQLFRVLELPTAGLAKIEALYSAAAEALAAAQLSDARPLQALLAQLQAREA